MTRGSRSGGVIEHDNLEEFADARRYDVEDSGETGVAFYAALELATAQVRGLIAAARDTGKTLALVTNEVGLGVVPASPLGRRYRDALGRCNQVFATAADEVILLVSGIDVVIKSAR